MQDELPTPSASVDRIALLQTFVRIVEAGSISAAATQMGSTAPTVSRRLQGLERELGVQLLQRSSRGMTLTEDGERCYERAQGLLAEWSDFEADLHGRRDVPQGTLRVVAPHAFGQFQLIDALGGFLERHPRVSIEWMLHDRTPDFVADNIDCAIHAGEVTDLSAVSVLLAEIPRVAVASPSLLGEAVPQHPKELEALPWLGQHPYYRDDIVLTHSVSGEQTQLALRPRLTTDNLFALRSAALRGIGVCVVSEWVMRDSIERGELVRLLPHWQARPLLLWLVYPRRQHTPARVRQFLEAMRVAVPAAIHAAIQSALPACCTPVKANEPGDTPSKKK